MFSFALFTKQGRVTEGLLSKAGLRCYFEITSNTTEEATSFRSAVEATDFHEEAEHAFITESLRGSIGSRLRPFLTASS